MRSFVCCDLGASSTRYATSGDSTPRVLQNNMVFVEDGERVDLATFSEDVESLLDITIESDNGCEYYPVRALIGEMAERFKPVNIKPSLMVNKHTQRINYVSTLAAVAVSVLRNTVDTDITVYLALPPVEVSGAKETVRNNLVGSYRVRFNQLKREVTFSITDVVCQPESFMALLSFFYSTDGRANESAQKYASGTVLSLDIGASTTDLAVVTNMRYLEKSAQTYKTGGNIARDLLMDCLREEYGFDATIDMAELAMAEGRIQLGNGYKDCSAHVNWSKARFAEQIVEQIQGYFRKVSIPLQTVRAIVVSGGGSMEGSYTDEDGNVVVTSPPISKFVTERLNEVCAGVCVEQFKDSPRLANIKGLFIFANIDTHRKQKAVSASD